MAIQRRPNRWTTRTEYESFCRWIYFHLCSKIFFQPSGGIPYGPATDLAFAKSLVQLQVHSVLIVCPLNVPFECVSFELMAHKDS